MRHILPLTAVMAGLFAMPLMAQEDADVPANQLFTEDVFIQGSLQIGFDAVNNGTFGSDTMIMRENNLRMLFDDTSSTASFPSNDWRFTFNGQNNGDANYFSIDDATANTVPFRIDAGAGNNALYIESGGNVGLGNNDPAVELHITDGDSSTLRLEQNGSSGFTPQTWDVAGNEANFFIRDVTNGSKLSFRIQPNTPQSTLSLRDNGGVVIGGWNDGNANASLHLRAENKGFMPNRMTNAQRTTFTGNLGAGDNGMTVYDTDDNKLYVWDGTNWTNDDDQQLTFNSPNLSIADGNTVDLSPLLSDLEARVAALETAAGNSGTDLTPDQFNYQAVVRDNSGNPLTNQLVNFRVSINTTNTNGSEIFTELKTITTNDNGIAEFAIGSGLPILGTVAAIDWSASTHYLKVEMDTTGGVNFNLVGFTQLLSVPYALHAKSAESIDGVSRAAVANISKTQEELQTLKKENESLRSELQQIKEQLQSLLNKQ